MTRVTAAFFHRLVASSMELLQAVALSLPDPQQALCVVRPLLDFVVNTFHAADRPMPIYEIQGQSEAMDGHPAV